MEEIPPQTRLSFGSRLGQAILWFFRALLRLILIVLVIGGTGAAIYYGATLINERFVAPVEQNAARVDELEAEIGSLQVQLTEINNQLIGVNSQLTGIKDQLSETNSRIDSIEQSVEGHTASLEKLERMQATLDAQLKESNDKTLLSLKHEVMMTRAIQADAADEGHPCRADREVRRRLQHLVPPCRPSSVIRVGRCSSGSAWP